MFTVRSGSSAGRCHVPQDSSRNPGAVRRDETGYFGCPKGRGLSCISPLLVRCQGYVPAVATLSPHAQHPLSAGPRPVPAVLLALLLLQGECRGRAVRGACGVLVCAPAGA